MNEDVIVTSFGTIGKRHVANMLNMGIAPFVRTEYPDYKVNAKFVSTLENLSENVKYAVICSPTYRHLDDIVELSALGIKNFLVEKPIEKNLERAEKIVSLAHKEKLSIHVAYNMRYLLCFGIIKEFIQHNLSSIRIVEICAGEHLSKWRPDRDYRKSYSVHRNKGGGIDLDRSHEIDYMLWLFGEPMEQNTLKAKISSFDMDSPDIFIGTYKYSSFVITIQLDCIRRKKERYIRIICENGNSLYCDIVNNNIEQFLSLKGCKDIVDDKNLFDMKKTYINEIEDFLCKSPQRQQLLATLEESVRVLKAIG